MSANWPLMLVNGFWLALLAMVVNALWVWLAMVVNGFATAWLWEWSLMLRASHAEGRFVGLCFLRGYLRFASCVGICASRGFLTLMSANWPLMIVNVFFVGYGANAR